VIVTERLVLSRIARSDVDELVVMLSKPELYEHIGDAPGSVEEAQAKAERWLRGSADPEVRWINHVARYDGKLVGLAQATVRAGGSCEIAYLVDPSAQRQGFGTEMMRAFCAELRATMDSVELVAHVLPGHVASESVARAVGLTPTEERVDGERVWR
jgi:RimJ/RimL family protein N-acetyltransferase